MRYDCATNHESSSRMGIYYASASVAPQGARCWHLKYYYECGAFIVNRLRLNAGSFAPCAEAFHEWWRTAKAHGYFIRASLAMSIVAQLETECEVPVVERLQRFSNRPHPPRQEAPPWSDDRPSRPFSPAAYTGAPPVSDWGPAAPWSSDFPSHRPAPSSPSSRRCLWE